MSEREKLKKLAEAATSGEWDTCIFDGTEPVEWGVHVPNHNDAFVKPDQTWHAITVCRGMTGPAKEANSKYIAAANPSTILALLAELEQAERERDVAMRQIEEPEGIGEVYCPKCGSCGIADCCDPGTCIVVKGCMQAKGLLHQYQDVMKWWDEEATAKDKAEAALRTLREAATHAEMLYSELAEREGSQGDRDAAKKLETALAAVE